MKNNSKNSICVIGLGYVGIQVAIHFAKKYPVIGFDINNERINNLKKGFDNNKDLTKEQQKLIDNVFLYTNNKKDIAGMDYYIVAVPTPINKKNQPDLRPLVSACKIVGQSIKKKSIVVFESTVFPGCTEEVCAPIIEKYSSKTANKDFFIGYSPERINPGDKEKTFTKIEKLVSSNNKYTLAKIYKLYQDIILKKVIKSKSIKVAETAKCFENIQRDINIALVNELSIICQKADISVYDVLESAKTKWNFLNFNPGLVGGHCVGVDPYYLSYFSQKNNHSPKLILSGRSINESMSKFIFDKIQSKFIKKKNKKILFLGYTFKENCSDIRNSKVEDLVNYFSNDFIDIFDPYLLNKNNHFVFKNKNTKFLSKLPPKNKYDAVLLLVSHRYFKKLGEKKIKLFGKKNCYFFDLKNNFHYSKIFETL